jgi:hypothetical protein
MTTRARAALDRYVEAASAIDLDLVTEGAGYSRPSGILQHWLVKERDALRDLRAAGATIQPKHEPEVEWPDE